MQANIAVHRGELAVQGSELRFPGCSKMQIDQVNTVCSVSIPEACMASVLVARIPQRPLHTSQTHQTLLLPGCGSCQADTHSPAAELHVPPTEHAQGDQIFIAHT